MTATQAYVTTDYIYLCILSTAPLFLFYITSEEPIYDTYLVLQVPCRQHTDDLDSNSLHQITYLDEIDVAYIIGFPAV